MKQVCSNEKCHNSVYLDGKCILHLSDTSANKIDDSDYPDKFNEALIKYIAKIIYEIDQRNKDKDNYNNFEQYELENYFQNVTTYPELTFQDAFKNETSSSKKYKDQKKLNNQIVQFIEKYIIPLEGIYFSSHLISVADLKYEITLQKIKNLMFEHCHFEIKSLELTESALFYKFCHFYDSWDIKKALPLHVPDRFMNNIYFEESLYRLCTFFGNVTNFFKYDEIQTFDISLFSDCIFKKIYFYTIVSLTNKYLIIQICLTQKLVI